MKFLNPFMAFTNEDTLSSQLIKVFGSPEFGISEAEIRDAVSEGWKELAVIRMEMQKKGEEVLKYMEETGRRGIVLAGRPYHVDPEINHGIPELITLWNRRFNRRLCLPSASAGASVDRYGSVDVPLPPVCGCKLCKDKR